jgi:hypothetical protein
MPEAPTVLPLIGSAQIAVTNAATELVVEDGPMGGSRAVLRNTGSKNVYIGNGSVTSSTGFLLKPEDPPLTIVVSPRARLFAITGGTDTSTVDILRT